MGGGMGFEGEVPPRRFAVTIIGAVGVGEGSKAGIDMDTVRSSLMGGSAKVGLNAGGSTNTGSVTGIGSTLVPVNGGGLTGA